MGGTNIITADTVHAIKESDPTATIQVEGKTYPSHTRGAEVVNIYAFDLPAAGWRVPLLLMFAGLALTLSS